MWERLWEREWKGLSLLVFSSVQNPACQELGTHPLCTGTWAKKVSDLSYDISRMVPNQRNFYAICDGLPPPRSFPKLALHRAYPTAAG